MSVFVPTSGLLLKQVLAIQPQPLKLPRFHVQVYSTTETLLTDVQGFNLNVQKRKCMIFYMNITSCMI